MSDIKNKVTIEAVITRADGTIEDLGVISEFQPEQLQSVLVGTEAIVTITEEESEEQ